MRAGFRPRRASRWRTATLVGVHLLIIVHVVHWLVKGTTLGGVGPDAAMDLGKHGIVNVGLVVFAVTILATAVFGRFFCGWGCHLIALQDLCRWLLVKLGHRPRALRSRLLLLVPLLAAVYMFLWPAAYRLYTGDRFGGLEMVWTTDNLWAGLPGWTIGALTLLSCGFLIVYVLGSKGFCTYACPYGAVFGMAERLAPLRVRVTDGCQSCARCTAACTSNVRVHEHVRDFGMVVDSGCMKCLDCVGSCPTGALHLGFGRPAIVAGSRSGRTPARKWRLSWPEELLIAILFAGAFVVFRGLYGQIPFLMALGVSGIMSCVGLLMVRLVTRNDLRFGGWRLRRDGELTRAGWVLGGLMAVMLAFWAHSAVVRFHELAGNSFFRETEHLRAAALALDSPIHLARGQDLDNVKRAIAAFDRSERLGLFANPRTPLKLAWMHLLAGQPEAFAVTMDAALEVQPGAVEVHLLRGREAVATGRFPEAVTAYSRAVDCAPDLGDTYLSLGTLLGSIGDLDEALRVFDRGIAAVPGDPDLRYNDGVAHALRGEIEEAAARFEEALVLYPEHRKARENLAGLRSHLATASPVDENDG